MEDAVFPENAFAPFYTSLYLLSDHGASLAVVPDDRIVSVCIYHTGKCEYADQGTSKDLTPLLIMRCPVESNRFFP